MLSRILTGTNVLEKSLDAALLRNEAISQNIANVDTPGYKRKTVAFEEYLNNARGSIKGIRTRPEHIPVGARDVMDVDIKVSEDKSAVSMRLDENNVDIEDEMAQMAKNTIKYYLITQRISGDFNKIKSVIKEGR
ncbi:flagellar basal body rod protein FlgB [Acetivibrio straminisolvens]|jgi:flagellar basal-body rod protein FlgB|uniref:Flagellar basal body rod protein FlgB n=1 Tax=Acetivibrio straminisolvens JCM 21531 TaxID=1294263 RepID=W4V889_9FIRM|nr:flagellar basal body rod protein FlgB [Acetivibrio straminisolvens]GAE88954.1 flagellar basal-body rod protein FlgB [Acetivibrio straminisolvens JCM 21531]